MLEFLRGKVSDRKVRLFACASCRRLGAELPDQNSWDVIEVAEEFADGHATEGELVAARIAARSSFQKDKAALGPRLVADLVGGAPAPRRVFVSWRPSKRRSWALPQARCSLAFEEQARDPRRELDRFRIRKHRTEAVAAVRQAEHRLLLAEGDETLKRTQHLRLFSEENLPERYLEWYARLQGLHSWLTRGTEAGFLTCGKVRRTHFILPHHPPPAHRAGRRAPHGRGTSGRR